MGTASMFFVEVKSVIDDDVILSVVSQACTQRFATRHETTCCRIQVVKIFYGFNSCYFGISIISHSTGQK